MFLVPDQVEEITVRKGENDSLAPGRESEGTSIVLKKRFINNAGLTLFDLEPADQPRDFSLFCHVLPSIGLEEVCAA
jgi:hypothetical protein